MRSRRPQPTNPLAERLQRPAPYAALVVLVVLVGVFARLPHAFVADDVFTGHADSKQYFQRAYGEYAYGHYYPLPHGGSGWPLLLAAAFRVFGVEADGGFSMEQTGPASLAQAKAILFAYAFHALLGAGLVVGTFLLARLLMRPLPALAAAGLVAIDPFLLQHATDVMADTAYALLVVLALACVVKARERTAWLAPAGALMAGAHMMRVNGLVMLLMVTLFAWVYLRRTSDRFRWQHLAIPLAAFLLVATPYLAWRAQHLPGAFDYGTNQRFWTDDPWNFGDAYWRSYDPREGGERETLADYLRTHTLEEAWWRAYYSVQWQVADVVGAGGSQARNAEGAALTPFLAAFALVGLAARWRDPASRMLPLAALFTFLTFLWIYPVVRSPRYFMPLIPLAAIAAVWGVEWAAARTRAAFATAAAILAGYFALHGVEALWDTLVALEAARRVDVVRDATFVMTALWIVAALAPLVASQVKLGRRAPDAHGGRAG